MCGLCKYGHNYVYKTPPYRHDLLAVAVLTSLWTLETASLLEKRYSCTICFCRSVSTICCCRADTLAASWTKWTNMTVRYMYMNMNDHVHTTGHRERNRKRRKKHKSSSHTYTQQPQWLRQIDPGTTWLRNLH